MRNRKELLEFLSEIKNYYLGYNKDLENDFKWKLPTLLEDLRDGNIEKDAVYTAIHIFGEARYKEAEIEIVKYLDNEDSELRKIALNVLGVHWNSKEYLQIYESVLLDKKEDEDNRSMAASCISSIFIGTKNKKYLNLLISLFMDKNESWYIKDSAYFSIICIWGIPPQNWPSFAKKLDYKKDIDWNLIEEIEKYVSVKKLLV